MLQVATSRDALAASTGIMEIVLQQLWCAVRHLETPMVFRFTTTFGGREAPVVGPNATTFGGIAPLAEFQKLSF
jgi:hypothetical protein